MCQYRAISTSTTSSVGEALARVVGVPVVGHSCFSLFSCQVRSDAAAHVLQHAWLPCPPLTPAVCSDACPLSQWCSLTILPSVFPCISIFCSELALRIRWPKYWSFSFSISPSDEYSGLISFRIDWFDLLAVQGTFQGLLQHHNSKASILWCSVFFMVWL